MRCCCNDPTSKRLSPSIANLFPDRSPVSFILETILIPFPIQTIFNRIKFENASKIYQGRRSEKKGGKESSRLIRNIPLTNQSDVRKRRRKEDRWRIHKISRARNPRKGGRKQRVQTCTNGRRIADASRMHRKRPIWRAFREPRGSNPRSQGLRDRQQLEGDAWKKRGRMGDSRQILGALSPAWRGTRCSKSSVEGSLGLFTRPQLLEL